MLDKQSSSLTTLIKSERDEMYVISDYNVLPYKKWSCYGCLGNLNKKLAYKTKGYYQKLLNN
jgi:hypothetical protein